jgi:hypothetical protein
VLGVLPGLGYLYDGYKRTALTAFLVNGLFLWGTAEAFRAGDEGVGAAVGGIGLGWYTGNIYGSVVSARRANLKRENDLLSRYELGFEF